VVNAGGLGQMRAFQMTLFQLPQTSAVLVDDLSSGMRWALMR